MIAIEVTLDGYLTRLQKQRFIRFRKVVQGMKMYAIFELERVFICSLVFYQYICEYGRFTNSPPKELVQGTDKSAHKPHLLDCRACTRQGM